jgi:hypothetical protein
MHGSGENLDDLPPFLQEVTYFNCRPISQAPTWGQVTQYFKPESAKLLEFREG